MKLNVYDAHDRFSYFKKQNFEIDECLQDLMKQKIFGDHAFYVFCHPRTDEDGVTKRYIWQPRLTKPKAQTNSALYKVQPGSDVIRIIWILPPREVWNAYDPGNVCENEAIRKCIYMFQHEREALEAPEDDDPPPEKVQEILFEYQPQLFRRDSLPEELRHIYDRKISLLKNK